LPVSGTFSNVNAMQNGSNSFATHSRQPLNALANNQGSHKMVPSPLGSRQPSLSPQLNRTNGSVPEGHSSAHDRIEDMGPAHPSRVHLESQAAGVSELQHDGAMQVKREQMAMFDGGPRF
jgi:hypothetical protein